MKKNCKAAEKIPCADDCQIDVIILQCRKKQPKSGAQDRGPLTQEAKMLGTSLIQWAQFSLYSRPPIPALFILKAHHSGPGFWEPDLRLATTATEAHPQTTKGTS